MHWTGVYISCPFETCHRILDHRMQFHITKCCKNYPGQKVRCRFNALHMLDPHEWEDHHLNKCDSTGTVASFQTSLEPAEPVGTIPIEQACNVSAFVPTEQSTIEMEDWSGDNQTYNPMAEIQKQLEEKNVIITPMCMPKSKKKQFKIQERDRLAAIEKKSTKDTRKVISTVRKTVDSEQPIRMPKTIAESIDEDDFKDSLLAKLKSISIQNEEKSSEKDISSNINNSKGTTSQESTSKEVEKKEKTREDTATALCKHLTKKKESFSKETKEIKSEESDLKTQENLKKCDTQETTLRVSKKFFEASGRISTGRGYTIARAQYLHNKQTNNEDHESDKINAEEEKENLKELVSNRGYNEDV